MDSRGCLVSNPEEGDSTWEGGGEGAPELIKRWRARARVYTSAPLHSSISVLKIRVVNSLYPPTTLDLLCLKKEISRMTLRVEKEAKVADYDDLSTYGFSRRNKPTILFSTIIK